MEYLEGQSLVDRLKKGPLLLKEPLKIGMEVCEALEWPPAESLTAI